MATNVISTIKYKCKLNLEIIGEFIIQLKGNLKKS